MAILTSYYGNKALADTDALKIGIARGVPKYQTPYLINSQLSILAPASWKLVQIADPAKYREAYRDQLNATGVEAIDRALKALEFSARGKDIILLCFESLKKPGEFCHRRLFAEWWEEQTGEIIAEYGAKDKTPEPEKPAEKATGSTAKKTADLMKERWNQRTQEQTNLFGAF